MTDMTAFVQAPTLVGVAPTYTAITAADKFKAAPNSRYLLHYKNGATPQATGSLKVTDQTTVIPAGSSASAGFADAVVVPTPMGATTEVIARIDNSTRFLDALGYINLTAIGTLTTISVAIVGPL